MLYKEWIKAGIVYVKQLFDENGIFRSPDSIISSLQDKSNWMIQYMCVKQIFNAKLFEKADTDLIKYTNIKEKANLKYNGKVYCINKLSSNFYYDILVTKKFKKPYYQNVWESKFNLPRNIWNWKNTYENKVKKFPDKKIAEFNYKLLLDKLPNGMFLKKWKKEESGKCVYCYLSEDTEHMLFRCQRVQELWKKISIILNLDISWKRLILGYQEASEKCISIERLLSTVMYLIFKNWILKKNGKKEPFVEDLCQFVKVELNFKEKLQTHMKEKIIKYKFLKKVVEKL